MSALSLRPASALAGIALAVGAVACFATLDTTTKLTSMAGVPILMALWFRYCFQAVATSLMTQRQGRRLWRTRRPGLHLLRGLLLMGSSGTAFFSLRHLPVAEFTAIVSLTPLVITFLAAVVLRERVCLLRWLLVVGGFGGALAIIRPGAEQFSAAMMLPLLVLAINTAFQLLTSRMVQTEDPLTMHMYTGWVGTLICTLVLPWAWQALAPGDWALLLLMGASATTGHLLLILAYGRAPVATLGPYLYAQIGFAVIGGWVAFSHTPDAWSLLGMGIIAACGAAGAWLTVRENRSLSAALLQPMET